MDDTRAVRRPGMDCGTSGWMTGRLVSECGGWRRRGTHKRVRRSAGIAAPGGGRDDGRPTVPGAMTETVPQRCQLGGKLQHAGTPVLTTGRLTGHDIPGGLPWVVSSRKRQSPAREGICPPACISRCVLGGRLAPERPRPMPRCPQKNTPPAGAGGSWPDLPLGRIRRGSPRRCRGHVITVSG